MTCIRWFDEVPAADVNLVGGKAANLGQMVAAGDGFVWVTNNGDGAVSRIEL